MARKRPLRTEATLIRIGQESLPLIEALSRSVQFSVIATLNLIRSQFNLGSQREAEIVRQAALAESRTIRGQEALATGARQTLPAIPLNPEQRDPSGLGRRIRYRISAEISGVWSTIDVWSDVPLTNDELERRILEAAETLKRVSPRLSEALVGGVPTLTDWKIVDISRGF